MMASEVLKTPDAFKMGNTHFSRKGPGNFICQYILSSYQTKKGYCHYFKAWVEMTFK